MSEAREPNPYQAPEEVEAAPVPEPPEAVKILAEIEELSTTALRYSALSVVCCGLIVGWVAIYRGHRALGLIEKHQIGHRYRLGAKAALAVGYSVIVLQVGAFLLRLMGG